MSFHRGMVLIWVSGEWGLLLLLTPCSTFTPGRVRGCYESGGRHAHLNPSEGLFNFGDSSSKASFCLKGTVPVLLIWRCISRGRLIRPSWHSNAFIFSYTSWITVSWTCLSASPGCLMVKDCKTGRRSTEFSPQLSMGQLSCSTGKSSTPYTYPYLYSLKPQILCQQFCHASPLTTPNLFRKEAQWGRTEARTYVWLTHCWSSDDNVSSPRHLQEGLPRVSFPRQIPPMIKSVFRREIM